MRFAQAHFTKRMQFRSAATVENEVGFVKQIEFPKKRRFKPAHPFDHSANPSAVQHQPENDETSLSQRSHTQNNPGYRFNHRTKRPIKKSNSPNKPKFGHAYSKEIEPRLMMKQITSATNISNLMICSSSNNTRKPEVRLSIVRMKTQIT